MKSSFTLYTLGCGSAKPSTRHQPSSTVIDFRGSLYMIDCGEGAQAMFQRMRLKFSRLRHIFLTHLHGDHVFGLPGLIGTLGLSQQGGDITIHTFADGKRILTQIFNYFCKDMPFEVKFNVIEPDDAVIYENKSLRVRTVRLNHRVPAVGYVFEEKEKERHLRRDMADFHGVPQYLFRDIKQGADFVKPDGSVVTNDLLTSPPSPSQSYAHISDTAYMPSLAEKIRGVDLLMHETTYLDELSAEAKKRGHSTALQAARTALDAQAGALLTGHYSSRYKDDKVFLNEARSLFPYTILNYEGLVLPFESLRNPLDS